MCKGQLVQEGGCALNKNGAEGILVIGAAGVVSLEMTTPVQRQLLFPLGDN